MLRPLRLALLTAVAIATGLAGCSIDDGSGSEPRPERSTTTSTTTEAAAAPTTTVDGFDSVGIVEVGGEPLELAADCYAPGAGEVLAIGIADTDDGRHVEVYLQAFLGEPYLAIAITEDNATITYEAAVDRPLDITYDADILRVDDVPLVTDLDLETGVGADAGIGSVVVECRGYEEELPAGFAGG